MAELVRIDASLFREDEKWFVYDDGRSILRRVGRHTESARSDFPAPMIRRDSIDPCRGPDGRVHESLSSLRRSYRADGNPQGETYHEIGNDVIAPAPLPQFDRRQRRDDIRAAISDVKEGRVPPLAVLED